MAVLIFLIVLAVPAATPWPAAALWSVVARKPYGRVSKMHSQMKVCCIGTEHLVLKGKHHISKSHENTLTCPFSFLFFFGTTDFWRVYSVKLGHWGRGGVVDIVSWRVTAEKVRAALCYSVSRCSNVRMQKLVSAQHSSPSCHV